MTSAYRQLPAVETLVQAIQRRANGDTPPHGLLVEAARAELDAARSAIAAGAAAPTVEDLIGATLARSRNIAQPSLRPLINATGVIIQTNLGRAPLSEAALRAMREVGVGYSNLEYDLDAGERGSRATHLTELLCKLTGAESALAVNNNAAAIYLALSALAIGREVIISRGQAVEIGGGFRIPDVLRQSGATLVEVGTTNRTYARDYAGAIGPQTALLMRIHTSNFKLVGFIHETPLAEMAEVARAHGVVVLDDLGSGTLLPTAPYGLAPEPTVQESLAAGADLVTFSGDKLLGGPQAGIIAGRKKIVEGLKREPLFRALRCDKLVLSGLESTTDAYLRGESRVPVLEMMRAGIDELKARAERIVAAVNAGSLRLRVATARAHVGGGTLPRSVIPSIAIEVTHPQLGAQALATLLRRLPEPVIGYVGRGSLKLDLRTVFPLQDAAVIRALHTLGTSGTPGTSGTSGTPA